MLVLENGCPLLMTSTGLRHSAGAGWWLFVVEYIQHTELTGLRQSADASQWLPSADYVELSVLTRPFLSDRR